MKNKKAEMTSNQLIKVAILFASVVVISLFLMIVFLWSKPNIDQETCHTSIVLRSTYNSALFDTSKIVPLKCRTEKICLSGGGDCNEFKADVDIKLSKDKEEAKKQVLDTIANAMYDCHSMLGEGKLDFMPNTKWTENYCLICSRFILDENAKKEVEDISYGEFYKYLEEKKTSDGTSYLEYLHPGWANWENSKIIFGELQKNSDDEEFKKLNFEDWKINIDYVGGYAVIAQIAPKGAIWSWVGLISVPVATIAVLTGVGAPVGITMLAGTAGLASGGVIFWYSHPSGKNDYAPPQIFPYDVKSLQEMKCSSFETAP